MFHLSRLFAPTARPPETPEIGPGTRVLACGHPGVVVGRDPRRNWYLVRLEGWGWDAGKVWAYHRFVLEVIEDSK